MTRSFYSRLARYVQGPKFNPGRRSFLATSVAAGGLLLSDRITPKFGGPRGRRVVVVGAGFSGLACAYELQQASYDVSVIEARNRVGGRVFSSSEFVKGRNIEIGAELIGSNHPSWMRYKDRFGLQMLDLTGNEEWEEPVSLLGEKLSREAAKKLLEEMDEVFNKGLDPLAEPIDADQPWRSVNARNLDQKNTARWLKELQCSDACRNALEVEFQANNGQDPDKQSFLGNLTQIKGHGNAKSYRDESEVYRCAGGNQQLAKKLAEKIRNLTLELPVRSIDYTGSNITVVCADGREIECDDVVIAVPPSVWAKIQFNPGLPNILTPQMGQNTKHFFHLKKRFWRENKQEQYALSDGIFNMTWEGTDAQEGDQDVVMVAFNGGKAAERARGLDAAQRKAIYLEELEALYPGFKDNLVGEPFFMNWPNEPWTKASYSFPAPGQVTTQGPILYNGIQNRIHFAGEHTCYRFVGYMEGALYSGNRVAIQMAARDGLLVGDKK